MSRRISPAAGALPPKPLPRSGSVPSILVSLVPLCVLTPSRRIGVWLIFVVCISALDDAADGPPPAALRLPELVCALALTSAAAALLLPLAGIAAKWALVGRLREGAHPLWGARYHAWFLARHAVRIAGRGAFAWHPAGVRAYFRLLGCAVGRGARIHALAHISEWDLVSIGAGATVDVATLRPFQLVAGGRHFSLGSVVVGDGATVCRRAIVVPRRPVPPSTVVPPYGSSSEPCLPAGSETGAAAAATAAPAFEQPGLVVRLLVLRPLLMTAKAIALAPLLGSLYLIATCAAPPQSTDFLSSRLAWFATPARFGYYVLGRVVRDVVCVPLYFCVVACAKAAFVGDASKGPCPGGPLTSAPAVRAKRWLLRELLSNGVRDHALADVSALVGPNLACNGALYRALGATVGARIWWPGTGIAADCYDGLAVGDDAVFGSRSAVLNGCGGRGDAPVPRVAIGDGAMVADRCGLMPGSSLGRCAVLGSGTLLPPAFAAPDGSVFLGNDHRCGAPLLLRAAASYAAAVAPTATPYGDAFLSKQRAPGCFRRAARATSPPERPPLPYFLWPQPACGAVNVLVAAFTAALWAAPLLAALAAAQHVAPFAAPHALLRHTRGRLFDAFDGGAGHSRFVVAAGRMYLLSLAATNATQMLALAIDVAAKWAVIGRRVAGRHNWTDGPYLQRWLLHRSLQQVRKGLLVDLGGTQLLVLYFRALGASIGANVCLYPNGGDPSACRRAAREQTGAPPRSAQPADACSRSDDRTRFGDHRRRCRGRRRLGCVPHQHARRVFASAPRAGARRGAAVARAAHVRRADGGRRAAARAHAHAPG